MIITKFKEITGHKDCIYALDSGNENGNFFTGSGDGWIVHWAIGNNEISGHLIAKLPASVFSLYYDKSKNTLLAGHRVGGLHVLDLSSKKEIRLIKHHTPIFDIQLTDKRGQLIAATGKGFLLSLSANDYEPGSLKRISESDIRAIAPHPNMSFFAVGCSDNKIRIIDTVTMNELKSFEAHTNSVFTLKYILNGKWLISGGRDAKLKIWDVENDYDLFLEIPAHRFTINHIDISPDGNWLATASRDKTVRIWDIANWKPVKSIDFDKLSGHTHSVNKILWTNYNDLLISAGDDKSIKAWKLQF